jgi:glycosyltransferase involved in cell wall biosynthesis
MENIKVIQLSTVSPSLFLNSGKGDLNKLMSDDWFAQVGKQIKKIYPRIQLECWVQERTYKREKKKEYSGIYFRAFPSIISIRPGMELSIEMIKALKKEIIKTEQENKKLIIHIHEYHSWQTYFILSSLKKQKNVKIIAQHHGGRSPFKNMMKYKRFLFLLPGVMLMQIFENIFFKKIDLFYALGDEEENYLKRIAPKSKIKFQTMGISEEYFEKDDKSKVRRKLGLDIEKKYLLFLGRIKTTKGIKELLDAMKNIKENNVELLLVGHGQDSDKYIEYSKKNAINNVKFLGAIYGKEKLSYLSACDYLILPSHTEGAPVVIMEAFAKNLPVIATKVGGIPKMIQNNKNGLLINPFSSEEIADAIKNIFKWKKIDVQKYAENYRWNKIIKATIEDYLE